MESICIVFYRLPSAAGGAAEAAAAAVSKNTWLPRPPQGRRNTSQSSVALIFLCADW